LRKNRARVPIVLVHDGESSGKELTRRGIEVGPLPTLEDLLWEWVAVQERSIRLSEGEDALWWHGERPSLGGFAGAIWRSGGFVLEEFSIEKLSLGARKTAKALRTAGRADMEFSLGGWKFSVEAKQCWPRLRKPLHKVEEALRKAERDAKCVTKRGYTKLAVVFAAPGSGFRDSLESDISGWIKKIAGFDPCARAWVFPELGKNLKWSNRTYPGAALFIKHVGGKTPPT
jgi:hypothetical protein